MDDDRPESVFSTSTRKSKYFISFAIYYCNFVSGNCTTFLSPLVLEFTSRFDSTVDQVSKVFTIILFCYLLSALLCTLLFKCCNRESVVLVLLLLVASSFFLIPSATNLTEFFVYSSLVGLGSGGYDTAQVAWIIDLWRGESAPWILSQHFAYALGTLTPPIILANFLTKSDASNELDITTNGSTGDTDISIPFYIVGCMALFSIFINFLICCTYSNRNQSVPIADNTQEAVVEPTWERESISSGSSSSSVSVTTSLISRNRNATRRKSYIIGLCCCVIGFYSALELCTQQFLPTYAHFSSVKLSPTEASRVLFGLQLGFTIGRCIGIYLVLKIRPHILLIGNLVLLTISNTILLLWGGSSMTSLWIGSIMIGVGMSTVYPSLYAYIEKYLFVTETVSGIVTVASGLVSSIYPLIVGNSVETNPNILMYVNYLSIFVCCVAFSLLFSMTYVRRRSSRGYSRIE